MILRNKVSKTYFNNKKESAKNNNNKKIIKKFEINFCDF